MDGNKDEALKCIAIAKESIASGNKTRALKFIKIAQRLNHTLSLDDLITACDNLDSSPPSETCNHVNNHEPEVSSGARSAGDRNYTDEHVMLIKQINKHKDYYAVLGVEKECSFEEIRKAYRKLSLKVHPDKNKAPGSEEAFKKVCKAFKCLSEEDSRRHYDQTGFVDEFEYNQSQNVRRRRPRSDDFFDEGFDPDEIFRAFFGQSNVFHSSHVYRTGGMGSRRTDGNGGGSNLMVLLQLVPFLLMLLLAYLPFSEPEYSLQRNFSYEFGRVTENYGVEYFVKSMDFDRKYPIGSAARENIEEHVIQDYKNLLRRYCHMELQQRQWRRSHPTPYCDKLQSFA